MTCGFSVSPGKLSFACVPLAPVSRLHRPLFRPVATPLQPLGHPFCPGPTCPHPFPSGPMGVAAQHHPNPHEHHALLPSPEVRCPRPRVSPQRLRPSLLLRLVASFVPIVADCSTTSGNTASPTERPSRLTAWRLPLAWRRPSLRLARQHGFARSATSTPPNTARKTSLGRSPARDRIKEGLDLRAAQCRSPVCRSRSTRTTGRTNSRSSTANASASAPVSATQIHPIFGFYAHPHPDLVSLPRLRLPASTVASGWPGRWTRPDCATCAATTRSPGWKTSTRRRPCSTSRRRPTGRSCWTPALGGQPPQSEILRGFPATTTGRSVTVNWASDVLFPSPEALATVYPRLLRYAITTFTPVDVMRFLGQPVPASGKVPHHCRHEVSSNVKERLGGVRIKHWLNGNSLKMYDKGSVLRVETLIRDPGDFKVYRPLEGDPQGPKEWRPLHQGLRPAASGRGQPGGQRALPGGADRSPGHDTAAATGRAVVPAGPRARAPPPQPSRPTDRVRRRGRRVGRVRRGRPAAVQGFRAGRWFHAGRGFRAGIGGRRDRAGIGGRRGRVGIGGRRGRVGVGGRRGRAGAVGQRGWRWAPAGAGAEPAGGRRRGPAGGGEPA